MKERTTEQVKGKTVIVKKKERERHTQRDDIKNDQDISEAWLFS